MADDSPYLFDNDHDQASQLLTTLGAILDSETQKRLLEAGLTSGSRCLDLGAGAGTMSQWMAEQGGEVVAADIKPQHIRVHPRVTVVQVDASSDALPEGPFDIILIRMLLAWLPQRSQVLRKAIDRLACGGTIVTIDWESTWGKSLLHSSIPDAQNYFTEFQKAFRKSMVAKGHDSIWYSKVHGEMVDAGLTDVRTTTASRSWRSGQPGAVLPLITTTEARERLIECGFAPKDIDGLHMTLRHQDTVVQGLPIWTTLGRRQS